MLLPFHQQPENRWQAFGVHVLVSLLLFLAMCTIIVVFWYPGVLFTTEGGWQGIELIAGIDFVIGPTLTLLIYRKGKKGLKYDLMLIGLLQALCISYGMSVVNASKPVTIAYADNIFYVIPQHRYDSRDIKTADLPVLQGTRPVRVNIRLPADHDERVAVKRAHFPMLETAVDLYEPFDRALALLPHEGFSLDDAAKAGFDIHDSALQQPGYRVFKLFTRYDLYAVVVDTRDGRFVRILGNLDPAEDGLVRPAGSRLAPATAH